MYKKFDKYTITSSYKKYLIKIIIADSEKNHKLHKLQYTYNYYSKI